MKRFDGGIDIGNTGRPGGVPTHIVTAPSAARTASPNAIAQLLANRNKKPATVDPFAAFGRLRRAIGNRLSQ